MFESGHILTPESNFAIVLPVRQNVKGRGTIDHSVPQQKPRRVPEASRTTAQITCQPHPSLLLSELPQRVGYNFLTDWTGDVVLTSVVRPSVARACCIARSICRVARSPSD